VTLYFLEKTVNYPLCTLGPCVLATITCQKRAEDIKKHEYYWKLPNWSSYPSSTAKGGRHTTTRNSARLRAFNPCLHLRGRRIRVNSTMSLPVLHRLVRNSSVWTWSGGTEGTGLATGPGSSSGICALRVLADWWLVVIGPGRQGLLVCDSRREWRSRSRHLPVTLSTSSAGAVGHTGSGTSITFFFC